VPLRFVSMIKLCGESMAIETIIANGDGDDAIRVGIAELEFHANMGGSYPEDVRLNPGGQAPCYAGRLSILGEFKKGVIWRRKDL
jgi:hypothetical protein